MCLRSGCKGIYMVYSLALFGVLRALTIDNQLQIVKNDCYERLAIGQRLSPKDIYKTSNVKTVPECQLACTQEKELCKSFSFGIGVKGNASCELSTDPVKETADLKPIGTRADPDFDLYIKKLGCTLVIDKNIIQNQNQPQKPVPSHNYDKPPADSGPHHIPQKPVQDGYGAQATVKPVYEKPEDGVHHVQTLVSISTGPQKPVLHPIHAILVGQGPYGYGGGYGYDSPRPDYVPVGPMYVDGDSYDSRPSGSHFHGYLDGIIPEKYGNIIPRPEEYEFWPMEGYGRPPFRPPMDGYNDRPPIGFYVDRPPRPPVDNYVDRPRPPHDGYDHRPPLDNEYDDRPPQRPPIDDYGNRPRPPQDGYDQRPFRPPQRPPIEDYDRPLRPPIDNYVNRPRPPQDGYDQRPSRPSKLPQDGYNERPSRPSDRPDPPPSNNYDQKPKPPSDYNNPKPDKPKPDTDYLYGQNLDRYDNPNIPKPTKPKPDNSIEAGYDSSKGPQSKPIVTQSVGPYGESVTSIITELENACFRRVLAGKRVTRALVKKATFCERVEDCQAECAEERRFACEGFNYRLDSSGRGKGECELLEIPLSHLDIGRDLYPDRDYDYYERDRNAASANCRRYAPPYPGSGGNRFNRPDRPAPWDDDRRPDYRPQRRPEYDRWSGNRYDTRRPPTRPQDYDSYDRRRPGGGYDYHDDDGYRPGGNRRGDLDSYHHSHHSQQQSFEHSHNYHYQSSAHGFDKFDTNHGSHYLPPPLPPKNHNSYKPYEPYLPPNRRPPHSYLPDRDRDRNFWGLQTPWGSYGTDSSPHDFNRNNYYLPPPPSKNDNRIWGQYGGSYGTGGGVDLQYNGYGHSQSFDFWGLNKYEEKLNSNVHDYGLLPPQKKPFDGGHGYLPNLPPVRPPSYLPEAPNTPVSSGGYLPEPIRPPSGGGSYLPQRRPSPGGGDFYDNALLPAEPRLPHYNFVKDECSLRSAAGFRFNKGIVKKFYNVPNLFECELLCFKERDFPCASYAYRYTITLTAPTDNCYLSDRNYKALDHYTDLQPDRDFDIYTMNNQKMCEQPMIRGRDNSECFWRVRSAVRLDRSVVRDSLTVKSIVECQLECLRSRRFTCRAFSFRYGSPVIGGAIDNCQLTDWPYYELDPRIHFAEEPGFELYERGSFGHGCEPDHFGITGRTWKPQNNRRDDLCYSQFGSPARLLPEAVRKSTNSPSERECRAECTKLRETTLFQCVSFSYREPFNDFKWEPNCLMSDILQRDLLMSVDYAHEPDSWLFAWDNYKPECGILGYNDGINNNIGKDGGLENRHGYDPLNALDTWRIYSVSGWPCRRGNLCQENREAGFWFCELEGGDRNSWDYCCRPDHQCGFSEGFSYQWCYVGPARTQWRKCSDRYYPYIHHLINDRFDPTPPYWTPGSSNYIPDHRPPPAPHRPGARPDRPPAPPTRPPLRPSLDEYEMQFDSQFLDPPRPGGFGQPRHWPLSYLHKEMPPNSTEDTESRLMKAARDRSGKGNPKFAAIQNLIDVIKSNDLKNVQYQIANESNKQDDILFVRIPLPANFTAVDDKRRENKSDFLTSFNVSEPVDVKNSTNVKRSQKALDQERFVPVYRKSYITRTNRTVGSFKTIDSIR